MMRSNSIPLLIVVGSLIATTGCSHTAAPPSPAVQTQTTQQEIQKVQNDPNIPADQKANIVAHFQNPGGPPNIATPKAQ